MPKTIAMAQDLRFIVACDQPVALNRSTIVTCRPARNETRQSPFRPVASLTWKPGIVDNAGLVRSPLTVLILHTFLRRDRSNARSRCWQRCVIAPSGGLKD